MSLSTHTTMMTLDINAIPILADIAPYYRQLAYNYWQHFKEDRRTPQNFELKGDERYIYTNSQFKILSFIVNQVIMNIRMNGISTLLYQN